MRNLYVAFVLVLFAQITFAQSKSYTIKEYVEQTNFNTVSFSPDGHYLVLVTRKNNLKKDKVVYQMWRITLDKAGNKQEMVPLTGVATSSFYDLQWSSDSRYLTFRSAREKKSHLYKLDMRGGEAVKLSTDKVFKNYLTSYNWIPNQKFLLISISQTKENKQAQKAEALYGKTRRFTNSFPTYQTVFYKLNTTDNSLDSLFSVDKYAYSMMLSPNGKTIIYATYKIYNRGFSDYKKDQIRYYQQNLNSLKTTPQQLPKNYSPFHWRENNKDVFAWYNKSSKGPAITQNKLYMLSGNGTKITNLTPQFEGHYRDAIPLKNDKLLAIGDLSTSRNIYLIDALKHKIRPLTDFKGVVTNLAKSKDNQLLAFVLTTKDNFKEVYLAKGLPGLKAAKRVTNFNKKFSRFPKPTIETISWDNGEGDKIEGVLMWPPNAKSKKNLPLVVDIHGGPWSARYETVTIPFNSGIYYNYASYLAMNGYLVFLPNYRGGVGRGDKFLTDLNGYSISRPCTDILTGVDFIVKKGWVDANRMAVMGISYGGLLTNAIISRTNQFKVALSTAGSWNTISYFGSSDNLSQTGIRYNGKLPWMDLTTYWRESPISGAAKIKTPTLIMFGEKDRRVPTSQGYEMFRALYSQNVPCELVLFPKEGHFWRTPSNQLTKIKIELNWLNHYLKGTPLIK